MSTTVLSDFFKQGLDKKFNLEPNQIPLLLNNMWSLLWQAFEQDDLHTMYALLGPSLLREDQVSKQAIFDESLKCFLEVRTFEAIFEILRQQLIYIRTIQQQKTYQDDEASFNELIDEIRDIRVNYIINELPELIREQVGYRCSQLSEQELKKITSEFLSSFHDEVESYLGIEWVPNGFYLDDEQTRRAGLEHIADTLSKIREKIQRNLRRTEGRLSAQDERILELNQSEGVQSAQREQDVPAAINHFAQRISEKHRISYFFDRSRTDIEKLLTYGLLSYDKKDIDQNSLMHIAVKHGSTEIVKALLAFKADWGKNGAGQTAWAFAGLSEESPFFKATHNQELEKSKFIEALEEILYEFNGIFVDFNSGKKTSRENKKGDKKINRDYVKLKEQHDEIIGELGSQSLNERLRYGDEKIINFLIKFYKQQKQEHAKNTDFLFKLKKILDLTVTQPGYKMVGVAHSFVPQLDFSSESQAVQHAKEARNRQGHSPSPPVSPFSRRNERRVSELIDSLGFKIQRYREGSLSPSSSSDISPEYSRRNSSDSNNNKLVACLTTLDKLLDSPDERDLVSGPEMLGQDKLSPQEQKESDIMSESSSCGQSQTTVESDDLFENVSDIESMLSSENELGSDDEMLRQDGDLRGCTQPSISVRRVFSFSQHLENGKFPAIKANKHQIENTSVVSPGCNYKSKKPRLESPK